MKAFGVCVGGGTGYFLEDHLAEVAGDVGQQVSPRVADLVHQLLGHRSKGDQAAGVGRLGENEGAVGRTLHHREAHHVPGGGAQLTSDLRLSSRQALTEFS